MGEAASVSCGLFLYLTVNNAAAALDCDRKAFGAEELFRLTASERKIGHAEMRIGPSNVILSDEWPDFGALSPPTIGGSSVKPHLYIDDADAVVAHAVAAGATLLCPAADQFYGDRSAMLADPLGHTCFTATLKAVVAPEEMQRRWTAALHGAAGVV